MTFEIGKHYRSRGGEKWRVVALDGSENYPIIAVLTGKRAALFNRGGQYIETFENQDDLLSEWIDAPVVDWPSMPAWAEFACFGDHNPWQWYSKRPLLNEAGKCWLLGQGFRGQIPSNYAPTFSGRWQDSLCERPKV